MRWRLGAEHNPAISFPCPLFPSNHLRTKPPSSFPPNSRKTQRNNVLIISKFCFSSVAAMPYFDSCRKAIGLSLLERPIILRLFVEIRRPSAIAPFPYERRRWKRHFVCVAHDFSPKSIVLFSDADDTDQSSASLQDNEINVLFKIKIGLISHHQKNLEKINRKL